MPGVTVGSVLPRLQGDQIADLVSSVRGVLSEMKQTSIAWPKSAPFTGNPYADWLETCERSVFQDKLDLLFSRLRKTKSTEALKGGVKEYYDCRRPALSLVDMK